MRDRLAVRIGHRLAPRPDRSTKPQGRCRPRADNHRLRATQQGPRPASTPSATSPSAPETCTTLAWVIRHHGFPASPVAAEAASHPGDPRSPPSVCVPCSSATPGTRIPEIYAAVLLAKPGRDRARPPLRVIRGWGRRSVGQYVAMAPRHTNWCRGAQEVAGTW